MAGVGSLLLYGGEWVPLVAEYCWITLWVVRSCWFERWLLGAFVVLVWVLLRRHALRLSQARKRAVLLMLNRLILTRMVSGNRRQRIRMEYRRLLGVLNGARLRGPGRSNEMIERHNEDGKIRGHQAAWGYSLP
jgi:hypothetical protein